MDFLSPSLATFILFEFQEIVLLEADFPFEEFYGENITNNFFLKCKMEMN